MQCMENTGSGAPHLNFIIRCFTVFFTLFTYRVGKYWSDFFPPFFSLGGGCGPVSGCYIITVVALWAELENTNNFVFSNLIVLSEQFRTIWFLSHWVFHQCQYHTGDSNWLGRSALVYYLLFLCRVNTGVDDHVEGGRSSFVITTC